MTLRSIKTILTNCPQICQIMEATKCIAAFIAIHKDSLCYTAQPEPTAYEPTWNSHILQSDMKESLVNKSTTVFFKKWPFCTESQRKVNKKQNPLISCTLESCEDFMKNIITNSDDHKLVYENGNIDFPAKEVCYHHNCGLQFTYQVQNKNPRTLPFSMMPTSTHFHMFKHMSIIISFKGSFRTSSQGYR